MKSLPVVELQFWGWDFWKDCVSASPTHLTVVLCCGGSVQLVFSSFSERIIPYVTVDLVCPWFEVSS